MPVDHYENFPVASFALPPSLRRPVEAIYAFARTADDFADEGEAPADVRIAVLDDYEAQLDLIERGEPVEVKLFDSLAAVIREHRLPLQPFRELLSAFRQDVTKTRYANFGEVMDYCRRSANPVGRLLMALFKDGDSRHLAYSDGLCSSLQLINFLQDVAIDYRKGRVYLPQDELARAGLSDALLGMLCGEPFRDDAVPALAPLGGIPVVSAMSAPEDRFRGFMLGQVKRVRSMLQASAPLGLVLKGRIGFETRMIIAGGDRILRKLYNDPLAPLKRRVRLDAWDWTVIILRALLKK
ncbi:MAG: squalene synthase HpnC [Pseudomonadota bacterium]